MTVCAIFDNLPCLPCTIITIIHTMSSLLEEAFEAPLPPPGPSSVAPAPPVPSFRVRREVAGVETELLIQTFVDRVFVSVSQNGKVGCLVSRTSGE